VSLLRVPQVADVSLSPFFLVPTVCHIPRYLDMCYNRMCIVQPDCDSSTSQSLLTIYPVKSLNLPALHSYLISYACPFEASTPLHCHLLPIRWRVLLSDCCIVRCSFTPHCKFLIGLYLIFYYYYLLGQTSRTDNYLHVHVMRQTWRAV
jgi:hypothetical protein